MIGNMNCVVPIIFVQFTSISKFRQEMRQFVNVYKIPLSRNEYIINSGATYDPFETVYLVKNKKPT